MIKDDILQMKQKDAVEFIKTKIVTNDQWLFRSIIAIFNKQTESEKNILHTYEKNKVGFSGVDGEIMSSFATQIIKRNSLSDKQKLVAKKCMIKYSGQLLKIIKGTV